MLGKVEVDKYRFKNCPKKDAFRLLHEHPKKAAARAAASADQASKDHI